MAVIDLSNVEIQKTVISGMFSIFNTVIAATTASLIGKKIANRQKLQEKFKTAIEDIAFLLEVEKMHCEVNKQELGEARKNKVRASVKSSGYEFSGRFTPGRVRSDRLI